jgi:hypothetical protein
VRAAAVVEREATRSQPLSYTRSSKRNPMRQVGWPMKKREKKSSGDYRGNLAVVRASSGGRQPKRLLENWAKNCRLISNRYPHEFSRLELRRLAAPVVDSRRGDLPMACKLLDHSQICPRVEQMGDEASPQVMAGEARHVRFGGSSGQDLGYSFAGQAFRDEVS